MDIIAAYARKKVLQEVISTASSYLGNTPSVCRSSYIHLIILSDWENGIFRKKLNRKVRGSKMKGLSAEETSSLMYLEIRR